MSIASQPTSDQQNVEEYGLRRLFIVAAVMAATLMQTLDTTITNVALPTIQGNVGASPDEATWVVTAYVIAAIVVIPITPWLQLRFGRKNYFVVSIVGFTIASVACGSSDTLGALTFWRVVQGAFGGGLLATAQSILRDTFPHKQLGASQGIFAIGAIMGPALGPPLGGYLVDNYNWNLCFDINILPGVFSAIVLFLLLRDPLKARKMPFDFVGLALLAVALGSMQYVLTEGEQNYWLADPMNLLMTLTCVVSLAGFILYELKFTTRPVVDLRVLANRSVWAGFILSFANGVAIFGITYVLPQFTQGPLGFTPTLSGLLFILRALPIILITPLVVRTSGKFDTRIILGIGFCLSAIASAMQAYDTTLQASFGTFGLPLILSGLGTAMLFIPLSIAVLGATSPQDGPKAAAFINLALQLGGSVAVAMLDVVIDRREQFHSTILSGNLNLGVPSVQAFLHSKPLASLAEIMYGQSTILSFADATFAIAVVSILCIPLIFLMRKPKHEGPIEIDVGG